MNRIEISALALMLLLTLGLCGNMPEGFCDDLQGELASAEEGALPDLAEFEAEEGLEPAEAKAEEVIESETLLKAEEKEDVF